MARSTAATAPRKWLHVWRLSSRRAWMRVGRVPGGYFIRFDRLGEFVVGARTIHCSPSSGVPMRTFRHLLLDQVLPAAIGSTRPLVLHASAVAIGGRAVAFLGATGVGKSTLAAALLRRGATLVTDDALVLTRRRGGVAALPTYPGVRLWPESDRLLGPWRGARSSAVAHYSAKQRWSGVAVPFCGDALPIASVYVVRSGARSRIATLPPRAALMALVRHSMLLDATNRAAVARAFEAAADVAAGTAVRRLLVGDGAVAIRDAVGAVLADAEMRGA